MDVEKSASLHFSSEVLHMKELKKSNTQLLMLIQTLLERGYKAQAPIWVAVAKRLAKPARRLVEVNVYKINKLTSDGDIVVVPGKVLGTGDLDHRVTVSAFKFSESARAKISEKGSAITIEELVEKNPKGTSVRIMGG
jgi:large subunit ribosomal protein L18e